MNTRAIDALVHESVFGQCVHEPDRYPLERGIADRKAEFLADYGQEAPLDFDSGATWEYHNSDHWPSWCKKCDQRDIGYRWECPRYSTDWAAAGLIIEKLDRPFEALQFRHAGGWRWSVGFERMDGTLLSDDAEAGTFPLAVCLAALAGVDTTAHA